jgi:hypothetical protein
MLDGPLRPDVEIRRKRLAVLAVHGVGNHAPFDTARRIGDLLQDLDWGTPNEGGLPSAVSPRYFPFREQKLRVNVRPTVVKEEAPTASGTRGPFYAYINRHLSHQNRASSNPDELAHEFMRGQLSQYQGEEPEDTYETIRLEGTRGNPDGQRGPDVDIYELHWADLSRLGLGILDLFGELYQLLFHLPSLGQHAVNAATPTHDSKWWRALRTGQSWAAVFLTVPIPIVNLLMLGVAATAACLGLLDRTGNAWPFVAACAIMAAAPIVGLGAVVSWFRPRRLGYWIAPVPLWIASVGGLAAKFVNSKVTSAMRAFETVVAAVLIAGALWFVVRAYNRRRPGFARWAALAPPLLVIPYYASIRFRPIHCPDAVLGVCFRLFEVLSLCLWAAWAGFYLAHFVMFVIGFIAVKKIPDAEERKLARRSRWTGRLTLSLSAYTFLVVTIPLWGIAAEGLKIAIADQKYESILPWLPALTISGVVDALVSGQMFAFLPPLILAGAFALLFMLWGIAPSAFQEVAPSEDASTDSSTHMGDWLTRAFGSLAIAGWVLYLVTTLGVPILGVLLVKWPHLPRLPVVTIIGGAVFSWMFLMRGNLEKLALGLRPALNIALDVDNWLREHPLKSNPKARISGRYVSLLRYICNWRNPDNTAEYDAILIVAHSQGTVITADLLRFLHREACGSLQDYDPQLVRLYEMPVWFFSMGCPLGQLYAQRFPHLYGWAQPANGYGKSIADSALPHPAKLRVNH